MSGVDFQGVAEVLTTAANAMERDPRLDPDNAVRLAVWGVPNAVVPQRQTTESDLYDVAVSAIECQTGWQGEGIAQVPRREAIQAAREEAARFGSYGGGR